MTTSVGGSTFIVLELAAGAGDTGFEAVAMIGEACRLISTDYSPKMVEAAQLQGHEQLLDAMRVRAIGGAIPEAVTPGVDCAVAIDLERRIQRMSEEHLTDSSYLFFASKQLGATRQAGADATPDSESTDPRHISEDVLMFLGHLHDVLATDADQANRIDQNPSRVITAMPAIPDRRLSAPSSASI